MATSHFDGVITIGVAEADHPADDARGEQRSQPPGEPRGRALGALLHQSGHYCWQRLLQGSPWLQAWRGVFGDERADYAAALQQHHRIVAAAAQEQRTW